MVRLDPGLAFGTGTHAPTHGHVPRMARQAPASGPDGFSPGRVDLVIVNILATRWSSLPEPRPDILILAGVS